MSASYEIEGIDDLFDELKDMEISDAKKKKALRDCGDILVDGIKPNLPKRSGKFRDSVKRRIVRLDVGLSVVVSSGKFYDVFQEYGTSQQKSNVGTFEKGVTSSQDKAVEAVIKELSG
jgi:HK97 gp10 family phage protein